MFLKLTWIDSKNDYSIDHPKAELYTKTISLNTNRILYYSTDSKHRCEITLIGGRIITVEESFEFVDTFIGSYPIAG